MEGARTAWSALLGGFVSALPNALFAYKLFQVQGARHAKQIVAHFYQGEAFKLLLSAVLFSLAFLWKGLVPAVFLSVYVVVQMVHWFAPWIFGLSARMPKVFFARRK